MDDEILMDSGQLRPMARRDPWMEFVWRYHSYRLHDRQLSFKFQRGYLRPSEVHKTLAQVLFFVTSSTSPIT